MSKHPPRHPPAASQPLVPNPSLNRAARTGKPTEDELLLERPKLDAPRPRAPERAAFTQDDPWRVLASHDDVATTPEPWLLLPQVYATRETGISARYVQVSSARAIRGR